MKISWSGGSRTMASYLYNTQLQSLILNIIFIIHHPRLSDINPKGGPCPLPFAVLCFLPLLVFQTFLGLFIYFIIRINVNMKNISATVWPVLATTLQYSHFPLQLQGNKHKSKYSVYRRILKTANFWHKFRC